MGARVAGGVALLSAASAAWALDPSLKIDQYAHTVWPGGNGVPTQIQSIAQTADGYLWLMQRGALVRFDGVAFEPVATLDGQNVDAPRLSLIAPDGRGGLWLGYGTGTDAAHYDDRRFERIKGYAAWGGNRDRLTLVDLDDATWTVNSGKLFRVRDGHSALVDGEWGVSFKRISAMRMDRRGTLWVADEGIDEGNVFFLPRGEKRFRRAPIAFGASELAVAPDGAIWGASTRGLRVLDLQDGIPSRVREVSRKVFGVPFFDRDGGLWLSRDHGLTHVGHPERLLVDGADATLDAEASARDVGGGNFAAVWAFCEDREGNVWVATSDGLERYRQTALTPIALPGRNYGFAIASAKGGGVIAGNWGSGLLRVDRDSVSPVDGVPRFVNALYRDSSGAVWSAAADAKGAWGVWRMAPGERPIGVSLGTSAVNAPIMSILEDKSLGIWFGGGRETPVRMRPDIRTSKGSIAATRDDLVTTPWRAAISAVDETGRVWLANGDRIVALEDGQSRRFGREGVDPGVGSIWALFARGPHVWIGGAQGVALFDGRAFHPLHRVGADSFRLIHGIVETASGDLWLRGAEELLHVDAESLNASLPSLGNPVPATRFDRSDGLRGVTMPPQPSPSLVEGDDGLLWTASNAGLTWIDPSKVRTSEPPQVHIRSMSVDGAVFGMPTEAVTLKPRLQHLEIAYDATELGAPEHIAFRYRLDGVDREWQQAGLRRVAYYNDLPPGDYRFRIESTDAAGIWNPAGGAAVGFSVAPAWYQAVWFRALTSAGVTLVLLGAYVLRVGRLVTAARMHAEARRLERERIARELHDTLLQSVYGLNMRLQAVAEGLSEQDPVRRRLETELELADRVLYQGRERLQNLRSVASGVEAFDMALNRLGLELAAQHRVEFRMNILGTERRLRSEACEEILQIANEALLNAFHHAQASRVELLLNYRRGDFRARIKDDGVGIAPGVIQHGRPKHFGLSGMRERAASIGASLRIICKSDGGTEIDLRVPGRHAYVKPRWMRLCGLGLL